eukprot:COSAG02_NODE_36498_length_453_cov_6.429379_1_plen_85_part_01
MLQLGAGTMLLCLLERASSGSVSIDACNVSGMWCYLPAPAWKPLAFHEDASRRFDMIEYLKKMPPAVSSEAMQFLYLRPLKKVEC